MRGRRASKTGADGLATGVVISVLLVGFYYLAYRYPLQIGSSATSPTYRDTPATLQLGKYILIAAILLVGVFASGVLASSRERMHDNTYLLTGFGLLLLTIFALVKGALLGSIDLILIGAVAAVGVVLTSLSVHWVLNFKRIGRLIAFYAVACVVVDAAQIGLYHFSGRLPSLGYQGSISVRFGAILDDPNGYAILTALLVPVVLLIWTSHRFWRAIVAVALLGALILTQSFTGITAVVFSFIVGYMALHWRSANRAVLVSVGGAITALAIFAFTSSSPVFQAVLGTKLGSINAHSGSVSSFFALPLTSYLGIGPASPDIESSYIFLLANFGLLFPIAMILIGLIAVVRLYRNALHATDPHMKAVQQGFYYYTIAFLIASANLKLIASFPANLLFFVGIGASLFTPAHSSLISAPVMRPVDRRRAIRVKTGPTPSRTRE